MKLRWTKSRHLQKTLERFSHDLEKWFQLAHISRLFESRSFMKCLWLTNTWHTVVFNSRQYAAIQGVLHDIGKISKECTTINF